MYIPDYCGHKYTQTELRLQKEPKGRTWTEGEPIGGYRENDIPLEWIAYIERTEAESFKRGQ